MSKKDEYSKPFLLESLAFSTPPLATAVIDPVFEVNKNRCHYKKEPGISPCHEDDFHLIQELIKEYAN